MSLASSHYPTGTYIPIRNASTSGVASVDVKLSASSAPVRPFKFNHCIIQDIATRKGENKRRAKIAESPSLDVGKTSVPGKTDRQAGRDDRVLEETRVSIRVNYYVR